MLCIKELWESSSGYQASFRNMEIKILGKKKHGRYNYKTGKTIENPLRGGCVWSDHIL